MSHDPKFDAPVGLSALMERSDITVDGCWRWLGYVSPRGYGSVGGLLVHRLAYELARGPIPQGLQIDHLCRVRDCLNPEHLEAVTQAENIRRGAAGYGGVRTTCRQGHDISDPTNVYVNPTSGKRSCRACAAARTAARRKHDAWPLTHCKRGHEFTPENSLDNHKGGRSCRECNRQKARSRRERIAGGRDA